MSAQPRELIADLFVSLDGFAAGEGQPAYFGYAGPELEEAIQAELSVPQVMVMGRVTYAALARIAAASQDDVNDHMGRLPKVVVSNTLSEPLGWRNTRLLRGDGIEAIRRLKQEPGDSLRTIGSVSLVASLVTHRLVDRLRLTVFPLVLGASGREWLYSGWPDSRFELRESRVLDSRLLRLEYAPVA
jgi:dihydrofolate reductase